jgi:phosphoserine aminotransferase
MWENSELIWSEFSMEQVFNFSAGPAVLPKPVLAKVQEELLNYDQTGMSVMELSHRSAAFENIIESTENLFRELLAIPNDYHVLFLQGGASLQFSMLPLNLLQPHQSADYIVTGSWSKKAVKEASKQGTVNTITPENPYIIPDYTDEDISSSSQYVHITSNNTIEGTRFSRYPETEEIPLIADMSSHILSDSIDVKKFGLIYAGAQKNLGPSGVTVVIIRKDLVGKASDNCPTMLDYETYVKHKSLFNTPPTFAIYVMKLVLEWVKQQGGVKEMEAKNKDKAQLLYDFLDESRLFHNPVSKQNRSLMNIPFLTESEQLNEAFLKRAKQEGLMFLKGHRSVGGMRASLYNAMPVEGVQKLVDTMSQFEKENR